MRNGGSRLLIAGLLLAAAIIALIPVALGHGRRVRQMREALVSAIVECSARYAEARTAADSAGVDQWVPARPATAASGDPTCGSYRRRNMLHHAQ
jgi:hypothetical protein